MSIEETEPTYEETATDEPRYSSFWPQVIIMAAIILWSGYQCFVALSQKSQLDDQLKQAGGVIGAAQQAQQRLYALAQDVNQTAAHDTYAAQIVKDFNIQMSPNSLRGPASH